ncbi:hypothetical protein MES5069_60090 [Mesorhizobium escarrei]|uniref:Uncharacterized protein n=1 Tax=Mesorhizobium escarrei TaxID=666018 RepID=A0ABM9EDQ2_9HYPH|nr:hypothetical protein MES5069_60090 [Mesorhizobium escarrei]
MASSPGSMAAVTADSRGAALKVEPNRLSRLLYAFASIGLLEVGRWRRHGGICDHSRAV